MRAVWSFWTKPFKDFRTATWASEKHHLLGWVLSFETARKHYPETSLVTDTEGARMLIDGIGLDFTHVSTELDALDGHDTGWWALGKLYAYRAQREPFIHLDTDVFLWKPLPPHVASASVFAQNPEDFIVGSSCYRPEEFEFIKEISGGWIPEEWEWCRSEYGQTQKSVCCGIVGGNRLDFIGYYADLGIRYIEDVRNQFGWSMVHNKAEHNILFEQYLLGACIEYHRHRADSPFRDIDDRYLFDSWGDAFDPDAAARVGYTHLIGGAKCDAKIAEHLEERVRQDYPGHYERCVSYLENSAAALALTGGAR